MLRIETCSEVAECVADQHLTVHSFEPVEQRADHASDARLELRLVLLEVRAPRDRLVEAELE